jgi:indole-3-glycerol phosphate synthase
MPNVLDRIVQSKRREIADARARLPESELRRQLPHAPPLRSFRRAIAGGPGTALIAEVKRASPSAGVLRSDFDPVAIAQSYAAAGASAISVLTDAPFFQGSLEDLAAIRRIAPVPLLRKDFILDPYQVVEARVHGADAVLLIAEILPGSELADRLGEIHALGMDALVELYDAENLDRVIAAGAAIIGINNRNLRTFVTDLAHTLEIAPRIPADRILVSESGIRDRGDVERLAAGGVRAVLVGETLMRAPDMARKIGELLGR